MKKSLIQLTILFSFTTLVAQKMVPEATELYVDLEKVTPGTDDSAPSDAIVLFDGASLDSWQKPKYMYGGSMKDYVTLFPSMESGPYTTSPTEWKIENSDLVVVPGKGAIATKESFADVQLHIEWQSPVVEGKSGQGYSNSGVFFMGFYEVQILNSYENETYNNGQAASVYKQHIPLVNASKPPGTWQTYDIVFNAPKFTDNGTLVSPARITALNPHVY
jgi:hypothetical protein